MPQDVKHPDNEGILSTLSRNKQKNYLQMREHMHTIARERPDIDTNVYTDYLREYLVAAKADQTILEQNAAKFKKDGGSQDPHEVRRESQQRSNEFNAGFNGKIMSKYGPNGMQAMQELGKKMQGPGLFSGAIEQVYNPKKGGLQLGGILGLIAGGLMATQLTGGLMTGELMPILITIGAGFLGAWLGNKGADAISGMFGQQQPPQTQQGPSPAQGTAPQQEQSAELTEEAKRAAFEENLKRLGVSQTPDGTSTMPSTPAQSQPKGGKGQGPTPP